MILALLPALVFGMILGRIWASLYRLRGPRKQPQATIGGLVITSALSGMIVWIAAQLIRSSLANDGSPLWVWVARLLPLYTPLIVAIAALVAHMSRRRALIRLRAQGEMNTLSGRASGVSDTPLERGQSNLG